MAWIYNLINYRHIFGLSDQELQGNILEYPGGVSSVNAELTALGQSIVSADPLYHLNINDMRHHAEEILHQNIQYLQKHQEIQKNLDISTAAIINSWKNSIELFLADYEIGKKQGRYRVMAFPPQEIDSSFELLLCADLLFNCGTPSVLSTIDLIKSLCRLATELRIFPLKTEKKMIADELGPLMLDLQQRNFGLEIRAVRYPHRRDAAALLRIWAKECKVIG